MSGITLIKDEQVSALLDQRHIVDSDIEQVISHAESTGEKLYQPDGNSFLAKKQLANATFYVEYSIGEDGYRLHSAYFHRSEFMEG